jgi:hypothetical protein
MLLQLVHLILRVALPDCTMKECKPGWDASIVGLANILSGLLSGLSCAVGRSCLQAPFYAASKNI